MALDVNNFRQILKCLLNLDTEIRTQAEVNTELDTSYS